MNCHVTTTSPLPHSHLHTVSDPNWKKAMVDEYNALISNGTWVFMPRPANVNVVNSMWLFRHKFNAYGSLSRYKARLVANGRSQQQGIDCDETFIPVVKPATIRTVLSLAVLQDWSIPQLDVKNAFLHGHLSETVYMHQPLGFVDTSHPDYYCNLCRTPVDTESKLGSDGDLVSDPSLYQSLAGSLQYLTFTRPDLSYAIQQFHVSYTAQLTTYTNANCAGYPVTYRSTSGYCVFVGDNLLSWSAKQQLTLSRSSAEAKYHGVTNVVAETRWLRNLLLELHALLSTATIVYYHNVSDVYLSTNLNQHQRTEHIEIDIHFVRDYVAFSQVRVLHVPFQYQISSVKVFQVHCFFSFTPL
ncbi:ribonuclease H-like domain-containing protein [Tanacetum coccineum]